jgi:hypothetical protein
MGIFHIIFLSNNARNLQSQFNTAGGNKIRTDTGKLPCYPRDKNSLRNIQHQN